MTKLLHVSSAISGATYYLSEPRSNFLFTIIRTKGNTGGENMETGYDCNDYIVSSKHTGYLYYNTITTVTAIRLSDDNVSLPVNGAQVSDTAKGFSIFGYCRI